jgi:uncharacterized protein YjbI with pentapeptide repeats
MSDEESSRPAYPTTTSRLAKPFLWIDWACQWIAYLAGNLAVFRVLEYAGKLTVLIALITWIADYPERQKEAIRTAWSVVNAKGGGRKESLEYLVRRNVDLKGLYGGDGYFSAIKLPAGDDLSWSNLEGANFESAELTSVKLDGSRLSGVRFNKANLTNASFRSALLAPRTPIFDDADIAGADFRDVTVSQPDGYRAFARAKNWSKAQFDDKTRKLIACAEQGDKAPAECQPSVPDIEGGANLAENQLFVAALLQNITCELTSAVRRVRLVYPATGASFLDKWGVQMTLTLGAGESGIGGGAARTNRLEIYFAVADLLKATGPNGNCVRALEPTGSFLFQNNLKVSDWLFAALAALHLNSANRDATLQNDVLQHQVRFVVLSNGASGSDFKLTPVTTDKNSTGPSLSTEGPRTFDLLVTFGPAASQTSGNNNDSAVIGLFGPAADLHRAALTALGIEAAVKGPSQ